MSTLVRGFAALTAAISLLASSVSAAEAPPASVGAADTATPAPAAASVAPQALATGTPVPTQRAIFELTTNGVKSGSVFVVLRGDDVLVRLEDLVRAGVTPDRLPIGSIIDGTLVSLRNLGAGASFKLDDVALTLALTLPAGYFGGRSIELQRVDELSVASASRSGFFNYAVGTYGSGGARFNGELGVSVARGLFDTQMRRDSTTGRFLVDQANFTVDRLRSGSRAVFGDTFVVADDFAGTGGAARLVGLTLTRDRSLVFSRIRNSGSELSGIATSPSVVEVYVNGALVRRTDVPPGPFQLSNLPLQAGSNQATIVVRDAFGRTQTAGQSFYVTPDLLRRGEREYQFALGKEINTYDLTDGRPLDAVARYAVGIRDNVTVGARAVVGQELTNVALTLATAGRFGEFSAVVAGSSATPLNSRNTQFIDSGFATPAPSTVSVPAGTRRVGGGAYGAAYAFTARRFSAGLSAIHQSPLYSALGRASLADRLSGNVNGFAQWAIGSRRSISVAFQNLTPRDQAPIREVSVAFSSAISRFANATVGIGNRRNGPRSGADFSLRVDANLSRLLTAHVASENRDGHHLETADISRRLVGRYGPEISVQEASNDGFRTQSVDAQYFTPRGNVALFVSQTGNSRPFTDLMLSGAIATAGGSWFLTQPINSAFAVVDTGGIPGAHVLVNNEDIGAANAGGRVIAANLFAYARNTITIDGKTLPGDAIVDNGAIDVAPPYRGGTVVAFAGRRVRAFVGQLRVRGKGVVATPKFGQLNVTTAAGVVSSDIGDDGSFYFDKLPKGTFPAEILFSQRSCAFKLTVPASTETVKNLGTLECVEASK